MQGGRLFSERKPSLTRSQTDSNITYMSDEVPEAPGSACYITKEGDLDIQVALKVIANCTVLSEFRIVTRALSYCLGGTCRRFAG